MIETYYPVGGKHGEYIGVCKGHRFNVITRIHVWGIQILFPFLKKLLFWSFITACLVFGIMGGMIYLEDKLYPTPTHNAEASVFRTGPPIKTFGGDGLGKSYPKAS